MRPESLLGSPRSLTHDEKKAAEAAFQGRPYDPRWSAAARTVYDGIVNALSVRTSALAPQAGEQSEPTDFPQDQPAQPADAWSPAVHAVSGGQEETQASPPDPDPSQPLVKTREEAIQAGLLIDVTSLAHRVGLSMPVGITKHLWDLAITASQAFPEEQHEVRVRDVLMALRLRLATLPAMVPWIEFPVLLPFPPEPVPRLCALHAIVHQDPGQHYALTLALREEVAAIRVDPNSN
jgi:hypothetical protein